MKSLSPAAGIIGVAAPSNETSAFVVEYKRNDCVPLAYSVVSHVHVPVGTAPGGRLSSTQTDSPVGKLEGGDAIGAVHVAFPARSNHTRPPQTVIARPLIGTPLKPTAEAGTTSRIQLPVAAGTSPIFRRDGPG